MNEQLKEAVSEAIREALGGALDCNRVWSAWGVGTMSEDDFSQVADDPARVEEITDAVLSALAASGKQQVGEVQGDGLASAARAGLPFIAYAFSQGMEGAKEVGRAIETALAATQPVVRGWSGWATQKPGHMPKLWGTREIAELNHDLTGDARLIFLSEQPAQAVDLPNDPGRTLYIDLDGVMADFDGAFPQVFGLDHRSLADDEMWGHINSHPSFFRDLPPMAGALDFFRSVEHLNPVILTACPKSNYPHVAAQKRAWVRAHLSQTCMVLPVLGGRHKPLFMHQVGDVLIDDFGKNCVAWVDAGGIAIKHEGDWTATREALALIDGGQAVQS